MTRAVSVGRSSKGLFAKFTLGALSSVLVTMTLAGCPGTLDGNFPAPPGGSAGSSGSAGAPGTAGMAMGTAGTSGGTAGYPGCPTLGTLFIGPTSKYKCSETTLCHDATGGGANFVMATADWQTHLVNVTPKGGGGTVASVCGAAGSADKTMPYIIAKSPTGDGLLIRKLQDPAPCGAVMPFGATSASGELAPEDLTCAKMWATALANQ